MNVQPIAVHTGRGAPERTPEPRKEAQLVTVGATPRRRPVVWIFVAVAILATLVWLTAPPLAGSAPPLP